MSEVQVVVLVVGILAAFGARRVLLSGFARQARAEFTEWLELGQGGPRG